MRIQTKELAKECIAWLNLLKNKHFQPIVALAFDLADIDYEKRFKVLRRWWQMYFFFAQGMIRGANYMKNRLVGDGILADAFSYDATRGSKQFQLIFVGR